MDPQILLQGFYKRGKYVAVAAPSDPHDPHDSPWWWDHLAESAMDLAQVGITSVWLPPATKAAQGSQEAALGYSVFDDYDIGSKDQKGAVHTRYGTREQLTRLAAILRANGLNVVLDLQLNHRKGGAGPDEMTFEYRDAFGNSSGGRFPKNRQCFHSRYPDSPVPKSFVPEIPQDPGVPDGIWELQMSSNVYFGPDLAHINGKPEGYVSQGLVAAVEWQTRAVDAQAYRLDHVQGISVLYLQALLNGNIAAGKFAVGEYWDGDRDKINDWITSNDWMRNRCSAFDFPLYFKLLAMSNDANFDMSTLDHAGLAGVNPFRAVTFVENHDTESRRDLVPRNIQPEDKPLAYAYILTSEGQPCVFFKDYSTAPGCLGDILRPALVNLMWIHQNIAAGPTEQRWKSQDVFMFERTGGPGLLVGLNRSKTQAQHLTGVVTNFRPNTTLHDYAGHEPDITTDGRGRVDVTIPSGNNGQGYVCYSVPSIGSRSAPAPQDSHQVFEGAADLDIPCAAAGKMSDITRTYCEHDTTIDGVLSFHADGWTPDTTLMLSLYGPSGAAVASRLFRQADTGAVLTATATEKGFYRWTIQANDSRADFTCPFSLAVRYRAPTTL
ncbi:alpha-amylase family glycosyl hydrolase [Paraburkholderia sp. MM5477-R1]|uniref:alpha-amylase family glycosyl hydrolase n=1 Tax=Paraburkholderia sp. MM5477-R1 TaxID=2991062 RepID=UPI003D25A597